MFIRVLAIFLCLLGIGGIGLGVIALQKPASAPVAESAPAPVQKVQILVAARPQRAGNLLAVEDLGSVDVPQGQAPAGGFLDSVAARSALRGAMIRRSLAANEPILAADVLNPGDRGYLAAVLGAG